MSRSYEKSVYSSAKCFGGLHLRNRPYTLYSVAHVCELRTRLVLKIFNFVNLVGKRTFIWGKFSLKFIENIYEGRLEEYLYILLPFCRRLTNY